ENNIGAILNKYKNKQLLSKDEEIILDDYLTRQHTPRPIAPSGPTNSRTADFTVILTDSYGDGWDGASMDVTVNGTNVLTGITVTASSATYSFSVTTGDVVATVYTSGSYESEHSYAFYDNSGAFIIGDGPSPGAGISFTATEIDLTLPIAALNISSIDFGNTGTAGVASPVVVTNNGGSALTISNIAVANADFSVSAATATVDSAGSYTLIVSYAPTAFDGDTSHVILTHDGASSPDTVLVKGAGVDAVYSQDFEAWAASSGSAVPLPAGMSMEGNMSSSGDGAAYGWEKENSTYSFVYAGSYATEFDGYEGVDGDTSAFITPEINFTTASVG
ncbi:MAG: hypothetical protein QF535_10140, partial [Anaerolineales bacterium]|nr:hypothetical protein [Anaerolineales bacterium]